MPILKGHIKRYLFLIVIMLFFLFTTINLAYEGFQDNKLESKEQNTITTEENIIVRDEEQEIEDKLKDEVNLKEQKWEIEIPTIGLIAPIAQGTTQDVMKKDVGHFENTSFWKGNIGLAAHNRGYPINYFEKVKDLKQGDEIIYRTQYGEKIYEITTYEIIDETNWSYLEKTEDNRITLITCVRNRPKNRLCVQAIEKI